MEHLFTGEDFYLEKQFFPIQNSIHTVDRIMRRIESNPIEIPMYSLKKINNLNVKNQPDIENDIETLELINVRKSALFICQVASDFSLTNIGDDFILGNEITNKIALLFFILIYYFFYHIVQC